MPKFGVSCMCVRYSVVIWFRILSVFLRSFRICKGVRQRLKVNSLRKSKTNLVQLWKENVRL